MSTRLNIDERTAQAMVALAPVTTHCPICKTRLKADRRNVDRVYVHADDGSFSVTTTCMACYEEFPPGSAGDQHLRDRLPRLSNSAIRIETTHVPDAMRGAL